MESSRQGGELMSDTTELVQSTIDKVLQRVDLLAAKLGIAAGEVWRFSVTAKAVEARADIAKYAALFLIPLVLWGWSIHILRMPVLHDYDTTMSYQITQGEPKPCDQIGKVNGKEVILHEQCWPQHQDQVPVRTDKG